MQDVLDWISQNWMLIAGIVGGCLLVARAVVAFTPNKTDDAVVSWIGKAWDMLSAVMGKRSAEAPAADERPLLPGASEDAPALRAEAQKADLSPEKPAPDAAPKGPKRLDLR